MYLQALTDVAPRYTLHMFTEAEILVNITEHKVSCMDRSGHTHCSCCMISLSLSVSLIYIMK